MYVYTSLLMKSCSLDHKREDLQPLLGLSHEPYRRNSEPNDCGCRAEKRNFAIDPKNSNFDKKAAEESERQFKHEPNFVAWQQ